MPKYEYRVFRIAKMTQKALLTTLQDELNGMGEMEWELDKIEFDPKGYNANECIVIYKRLIPDHQE